MRPAAVAGAMPASRPASATAKRPLPSGMSSSIRTRPAKGAAQFPTGPSSADATLDARRAAQRRQVTAERRDATDQHERSEELARARGGAPGTIRIARPPLHERLDDVAPVERKCGQEVDDRYGGVGCRERP